MEGPPCPLWVSASLGRKQLEQASNKLSSKVYALVLPSPFPPWTSVLAFDGCLGHGSRIQINPFLLKLFWIIVIFFYFYFIFFYFYTKYILPHNIFWLWLSLHWLLPVPLYLLFYPDPFPFCLLLENRHLRDNNRKK